MIIIISNDFVYHHWSELPRGRTLHFQCPYQQFAIMQTTLFYLSFFLAPLSLSDRKLDSSPSQGWGHEHNFAEVWQARGLEEDEHWVQGVQAAAPVLHVPWRTPAGLEILPDSTRQDRHPDSRRVLDWDLHFAFWCTGDFGQSYLPAQLIDLNFGKRLKMLELVVTEMSSWLFEKPRMLEPGSLLIWSLALMNFFCLKLEREDLKTLFMGTTRRNHATLTIFIWPWA